MAISLATQITALETVAARPDALRRAGFVTTMPQAELLQQQLHAARLTLETLAENKALRERVASLINHPPRQKAAREHGGSSL